MGFAKHRRPFEAWRSVRGNLLTMTGPGTEAVFKVAFDPHIANYVDIFGRERR
jgi:hypothetical protein